MLLGLELLQRQRLPLLQVGQGGLDLLLVLVLALHVHGGEAGKFQGGVIGPEAVARGLHLDGHAVIDGGGHLTGQKPAPNQLVEPVLFAGQILLDVLRGQAHVGGPDGLVGVLGPGFGLVMPGLVRIIVLAVAVDDQLPGGRQGLLRQAQGVGTHIGDEAHGALALDVHALVELLGHRHGPPGRHAQLAAGLLLEGGGDEGRRGIAGLVLALDALHGKGGRLHGVADGPDLLLAAELLLLLRAVEGGGEGPQIGGDAAEIGVQGPVFLGLKGPDLLLPLAHQPGGHRLDPSGGQAPADFFPQQRRELVAHDAVQDAAGLLGVHQVLVNGPRGGDGLVDHFFGDLIEGDPVSAVVGQLQKLLEVPGNGLPLPVRVGGQKDLVTLLGRLFQVGDDLLLPFDGLVVRYEAVLHIHADLAFGQVPDVTHGRLDLIIRSKVFADGLGLGRRFYND